jgi:hypothetical protein
VKTTEQLLRLFAAELQNRPELFTRAQLRKLTVEFAISRDQQVRAVNFTPSEHREVELA